MAHSGTLIVMRNVPGEPKNRALWLPLIADTMDGRIELIPTDFEWDGSSVPWLFRGLFPRHWHPIASCRHDWRCKHAKNAAERKWADEQFRKDVGTTSWKVTSLFGYVGVRAGAFIGSGVNYAPSELTAIHKVYKTVFN